MTYFFNPALPGALPPVLPLFPLPGILLLPGGELPLNIFEDRYIAMVDHVLGTPNRMIGIIQTRPDAADTRGNDLYSVGCAGRVTSFHETEDGRYMITLAGVCRFHVNTEIEQMSGFRCIVPNFDHFLPHDAAKETAETPLDRMRLIALLRDYFDTEGMTCKWQNLQNTCNNVLMTALSMACPFSTAEKQALLEAITVTERGELFLSILERAVSNGSKNNGCIH